MTFNYEVLNFLKNYAVIQANNNDTPNIERLLIESIQYLTDVIVNFRDKPFDNIDLLCKQLHKHQLSNDKSPYIGVEIELENVDNPNLFENQDLSTCKKMLWVQKADGSLRNNGQEFITAFGTTVNLLPLSLTVLDHYLIQNKPAAIANARTGLHVHYNVQGLSLYELMNVLFLYSTIEPAFFFYSGNRFDNIFCVPWCENKYTIGDIILGSAFSSKYNRADQFRWRNYSKYCGLNVSTVATFGTLEFRMHKGSKNTEEIMNWVKTIDALFTYAKNTDLIRNIELFRTERTNEKYLALIKFIFNRYKQEPTEELIKECRRATIKNLTAFNDDNYITLDQQWDPNKTKKLQMNKILNVYANYDEPEDLWRVDRVDVADDDLVALPPLEQPQRARGNF